MQQDKNQKTIIVATVAFLIGFGLAWLIFTNKTTNFFSNDNKEATTTSEMTGGDFILLGDQVEGVRVLIEKVVLADGGWVVIHEDDSGMPGRILGAQLFDAGIWTNGSVDLLRGMIAGNNYYAMAHADNGDRAFDPKKDLPISDEEGETVMTQFNATADTDSVTE